MLFDMIMYLVTLLRCGDVEIPGEVGGREFILEAVKVALAQIAVIPLEVLGHERLVLGRAGGDVDVVQERFPEIGFVTTKHTD